MYKTHSSRMKSLKNGFIEKNVRTWNTKAKAKTKNQRQKRRSRLSGRGYEAKNTKIKRLQ